MLQQARLSVISNISSVTESRYGNKKQVNYLEKNLNKLRYAETSLNAFGFLFSELIQYSQKRVRGIPELERKLALIGRRIGPKLLELTLSREKTPRRETRLVPLLVFLQTTFWKQWFGKQADQLEKGSKNPNQYWFTDNEPLFLKYISVPKDLQTLNCGALMAGIIESVLECCQFPAKVTAQNSQTPVEKLPLRTMIVMEFHESVIERERKFDS